MVGDFELSGARRAHGEADSGAGAQNTAGPAARTFFQSLAAEGGEPRGSPDWPLLVPPPLLIYLAQTTVERSPSLGATCRQLCTEGGGCPLLAQGAHSRLRTRAQTR